MGEFEDCSQQATQPSNLDASLLEDADETIVFSEQYWGRLYPALPNVQAHDLTKDETLVGKQKSCDITLKPNEVPSHVWVVASRRQFSILKVQVEKFGKCSTEVRLKDMSMNGTFINGSLVGKGKTKVLSDNNIIALGKPHNNVYYFKDASVINSKHPPSIRRHYDAAIQLGTGAYGEVTLMFCKKSRKGYAMKSILKGNHTSKKKVDSEMERLENEVKILQRIKHPNVIQLVHHVTHLSEKYLFLELMYGKDLFSRITNSKRLTESQAKLYFYQIASGVQYLHQNEIIHRDLKPENVLMATDDVETVVKITDFGLSKVLHSNTNLRSLCGTKLYVAPEVLEGGGTRVYTGKVDVWSMGVILYVCLSGQTPFSAEKNGPPMDDLIKRGHYSMPHKYWECVSTPAMEIVKRMMTLDVSDRITLSDIFAHPWLQDPELHKTIERLLPRSDPPSGKRGAAKMSSQDKENLPTVVDVDEITSSPVSAAVLMSPPPLSPRRKRRKCTT
ncbi:ovarian-specific serine/threonine-protein kinase Lok-like [Thrips palmi]|uniref:Ovarian-specific serine/threonine-protein kinase Lok-like n=1 Tax=Thrips palmi TaxID=161013 RepID=A0A6P8YTS5_THRPL|nr:ovarian-specific serine/threonine-protein kinase Lok-like [Thrips palmi]XP_034240511.1 ovarian-specific serine/threonine-protein kinase Lok-like [Thrips palmi]